MLRAMKESAVPGTSGAGTVQVRVLTQEQGRALVLVEGVGHVLRHGDVVTVDVAAVQPLCSGYHPVREGGRLLGMGHDRTDLEPGGYDCPHELGTCP
jgi:hypothetical protein